MVCVLTNSLIPVMKEYLERSMIFSALALDHSQRVPPLWRSVGRVVADPEIWCEVVEVGLVYLKLTGEYSFPGNGQSPSPSHPCCLPGYQKLRKRFVNSGTFVALNPPPLFLLKWIIFIYRIPLTWCKACFRVFKTWLIDWWCCKKKLIMAGE